MAEQSPATHQANRQKRYAWYTYFFTSAGQLLEGICDEVVPTRRQLTEECAWLGEIVGDPFVRYKTHKVWHPGLYK